MQLVIYSELHFDVSFKIIVHVDNAYEICCILKRVSRLGLLCHMWSGDL